jgi:Tol biopolymer transport system component
VLRGAEGAQFVETGHLLYSPGESVLRAVPFDLARHEVDGNPVSVLEELFYVYLAGRAFFGVSGNGTFTYVPGSMARRTLVWVDREGRERPVANEQGEYDDPTISPDGTKVAFCQRPDIWTLDLARGTRTRLTSTGNNQGPIWTPDGSKVYFSSNRAGGWDIYSVDSSGTGETQTVLSAENLQLANSFSPAGSPLAFMNTHTRTGMDIWMFPKEGEPFPFLNTQFRESTAQFSPDGRFLAYVSNETGPIEVYVVPYPKANERWTVSINGGTDPKWSRNGKELFYRRGNEMVAVEIKTNPSFSVGGHRTLFRGLYYSSEYDVSLDGKEFLMVRLDPGSIPTQINIVTNWFEELERLVPTN